LASLGVALINKRPAGERHHVGKTIILAMFAAASYAILTHTGQLLIYVLTGTLVILAMGLSFKPPENDEASAE